MDGPTPKNSETFVRALKQRNEPSYYEIVTDPIDMLRINRSLKYILVYFKHLLNS